EDNHGSQRRNNAPSLSGSNWRRRTCGRVWRSASRSARNRAAGLSDEYVGDADLLPVAFRAIGKARREIRGIRRSIRHLTMQQMVARQVDMGTYAGPSFAIGYDKGGLLAIAMIEYVGKTARVMARKDLG